MKQAKTAFTLVELLVVIAIISILAAMLLPTLADALESGRRVVCANNEKQLCFTSTLYAGDFNDVLPPGGMLGANHLLVHSSQRTWLVEYAQVPLYDKIKALGGVCLSDYQSPQYTTLSLPDANNILFCPTVKPAISNTNKIWFSHYYPTGFGSSYWISPAQYQSQDFHNYTKLGCIAAPLRIDPFRGAKKLLFRESAWFLNTNGRDQQPHRNGTTFDGMNILTADGAVKWLPYVPTEASKWNEAWATAVSTGNGYCGMMVGTATTFYFTGPNGRNTYGKRDVTGNTAWGAGFMDMTDAFRIFRREFGIISSQLK